MPCPRAGICRLCQQDVYNKPLYIHMQSVNYVCLQDSLFQKGNHPTKQSSSSGLFYMALSTTNKDMQPSAGAYIRMVLPRTKIARE